MRLGMAVDNNINSLLRPYQCVTSFNHPIGVNHKTFHESVRRYCIDCPSSSRFGNNLHRCNRVLPPVHPLLVAALRSLPVGLLLTRALRKLPHGIWWGRILILGALNIGIMQALLFIAAYRLPVGVAATAGAIQPLLVILFSWLILQGTSEGWRLIAIDVDRKNRYNPLIFV